MLVVGWCLPIVVERSTPDSKIENLHNHIGARNVNGGAFHNKTLLQILCESPVEQQETCFGAPLNSTHALFDKEDGFATPSSLIDFLGCQFHRVCWINEVGADFEVDVEKYNEDGVEALAPSASNPAIVAR